MNTIFEGPIYLEQITSHGRKFRAVYKDAQTYCKACADSADQKQSGVTIGVNLSYEKQAEGWFNWDSGNYRHYKLRDAKEAEQHLLENCEWDGEGDLDDAWAS